jgi:hypothetical protein
MSLITRVKSMLVTPKEEWTTINNETATPSSLLTGYLLPLALAGAVAAFIGAGLIGSSFMGIKVGGTIKYGVYQALVSLISVGIGYYLTTYVVDMLATNFKSEKNLNKSAQLIAYSYTPALVGSLMAVIPAIAWLGSLFGLYSIYLIYLGLPVLKKTPEEQRVVYLVVTILVLIGIYIVIGMILASVLMPIFGLSALSAFGS